MRERAQLEGEANQKIYYFYASQIAGGIKHVHELARMRRDVDQVHWQREYEYTANLPMTAR